MATKPISVRVSESVKLELEQIARRFGTRPATLGADYVTQGVRTTRHPSIEFRQTPAGRMAYVRGVRLPVWLAVETSEECGGRRCEGGQTAAVARPAFQSGAGIRQGIPG
jgi:hypothetical protein